MSSAASLTAIAVLENPRLIPKTKSIVFDAQIYLGSSEPALISSLRYFNADNLEFAEVGCYFVDVHPARTNPTVEVYSQELTPVDYHVFGDIVKLVPLGSPENFDLHHHALQYKPMTGKGKSVAIEGLLTGLERNDDRTVKHFIVDLEKVTFLGQSATAPRAEESPKKIVNTGTPARLKFTGFFGGQETESKSEGPSSKKRKTADDRAVEESEDKGEGPSTGPSTRRGARHESLYFTLTIHKSVTPNSKNPTYSFTT
ncbi:hypothetical protein B0H13DRAFT_1855907 [Mycena leptocephala]|nr:hypothetical protein B0H13DRAFT_1855907 [Mycena leptocephala]